MKYSSRKETLKHIRTVRRFIFKVVFALIKRAFMHDRTKLHKPEKEGFDIYTPKLANTTYGSEKYKQYLSELKPYLDHHYAKNRHHPEYYEEGIGDMDLVDLIEMLCDWYAASMRHNDGNIVKSIWNNQERFKYSNEIKRLLLISYRNFFCPSWVAIPIDGSTGWLHCSENKKE